ncbi:AAA family ATPase [Candidatus Aerophobetes bacterium]|nr:AAA family ATPase [Candidatus Aerophobetes bacterium]
MALTVAVAGKGGVGKTTFAALVIRELILKNLKPVLAVDADPNSNLNIFLGINVYRTVGSLREEALERVKKMDFPEGMSKVMYMEYGFQECIAEGDGFDLLVMGRPEGPGCYCFANDILRSFIDKLSPNYRYVVIDTEAGMEHLSRRTTRNVDVLFIISDKNPVSLRAAERINNLVEELKLKIGRRYLVLNMQNFSSSESLKQKLKGTNLKLAGTVPQDSEVFSCAIEEKPVFSLSPSSPAVSAVRKILEDTGVIEKNT